MKRYSLVASLLIFCPVIAESQPDIRPCVIRGACGNCNSSSCSSCRLMAHNHQGAPRDANVPCVACNNASSFCVPVKDDARKLDDVVDQRCRSGCLPPYTAFIPRSQGTNTARELVGWEEFIHQFDVGGYYLTTGHILGYYRSFRPERLAQELFGDTVLRFAGSQIAQRGSCELLADNFGLSADFRGTVEFSPLIENIVFDNQFFIGLDPIACGLYARFHMPLVHTRWDLRACQTRTSKHYSPFPDCYMAEDETSVTGDILMALSGYYTFGDMQTPWEYGRICSGVQTKTGLADIDVIVGYDIRQSDTHHLGFYGQLVLPTGNKFTARYLFEPLVGNARHVEVGAGFSGHVILYEHTAESSLALWAEGNLVHMVKNKQMRSFDFCHAGPLSRYMLLKELEKRGENYFYTGNLINAINFATREVEVSIAAKADISAKFAVRTPRIVADVGYNFYGRTKEHVDLTCACDDRIYAIKGTEGVCGLEYATVGDQPPIEFGPLIRKISLNSSQHRATIRESGPTDNPQDPPVLNPSDIVVTAFSPQQGPISNPDVIQAKVSAPPVLVTVQDLHIPSGELPAQATHKFFGYLGYNCFDLDWCYNPYLGIGGEIEWDARSCDERSALNQWSIFLKGGFEF